jgi:acetyl/propionyl-CoA carboxylase alpha subunit
VFGKVLVANRGEIALRIVRALRDLEIRSVAVYSDVDRLSQHVRYADEAHLIGPADARQSYLNGAKIIEVALAAGERGAPRYGFLAENADFAERASRRADVHRPFADSIRKLGDKIQAREIAIQEAFRCCRPARIADIDEAERWARRSASR